MNPTLTPDEELELLRVKVELLGDFHIGVYVKAFDPQLHWFGCLGRYAGAKYVHIKGQRNPPGIYFFSEREVLEAIISACTDPDSLFEATH